MKTTLEKIVRALIWIGFGVIIFSPLYLNSHIFFPYIVTKTLAFNAAVEFIFLLLLFLNFKFPEKYKIRFNWPLIVFAVYILIVFIASLLGDNFLRSFWSNSERSEGIVLLLHLFLFLFVVVNFFRDFKSWLAVFDTFFVSGVLVSLFAFGQYLEISWLFASGGGARLAGTIGNAGYMAGFLVFSILFGVILLFKRKNLYLRIYYLAVIALELFIAVFTETRGAWLALAFSGLALGIYLSFFYFNSKKLKIVFSLAIMLALLTTGFLFANKSQDFIQKNRILRRITSISFDDTTTQNRLMTWITAWQGFKERPVLGWGYENFYQPFDKYYNPLIYRHSGSTIWYDRAHDIIFDRLITGGIAGLAVYLVFLFLPFILLWRHHLQTEKIKTGRDYFLPFILTLVIIAYFIQNIFIFEALVIYIPLFLVIGLAGLYSREFVVKTGPDVNLIILGSYCVLLPFIVYYVNVGPLLSNLRFTQLISNSSLTVDQRIDAFKSLLSENSHNNQEYRVQLFSFYEGLLQSGYSDQTSLTKLINLEDGELKKQIEENPRSVTNYLLLMRLNNTAHGNNPGKMEENLALFDQAAKLSPNRQQLYFETGYSYFYLSNIIRDAGVIQEADKNYQLGLDQFNKAIDLNDNNFESYRQLVNVLVYGGKNKEVLATIDKMADKKVSYNHEQFFTQIINSAVKVKNYSLIKDMAGKLIELDANKPEYYIQLALANAYLGDQKAAIAAAQKVASFGDAYVKQSQDFISRIKAGEFKK